VKFEDEDDLISFTNLSPHNGEQNKWGEHATTSRSSTPVASASVFSQVDFPAALTVTPKHAAQQFNLPAPKPAIEAADFPALVPKKVVKTTKTEAKVANAWGPKHLAAVTPAVTAAVPTAGNAFESKQKSFPNTPASVAPTSVSVVESKAGGVWGATQKLFPDAPPAISPPAQFLQALTVKSSKEEEDEDPLDPDSKSFNAKRFYIEFIGKFRCPHRGCR
jgi:hypothetical protein